MRVVSILATLAFFAISCSGTVAPTAIPTDTQAPSVTPAPQSSSTPSVTPTAESPSAAPTYDLFAPGVLSCRVVSQSIRNGKRFDPKERFDMAWQVKNTGIATWDPESIQFRYYTGARLHVSEAGKLREIVDPGDNTSLVTDMIAPKQSGKYTTVWTLRGGTQDFCHVTLSITVR